MVVLGGGAVSVEQEARVKYTWCYTTLGRFLEEHLLFSWDLPGYHHLPFPAANFCEVDYLL